MNKVLIYVILTLLPGIVFSQKHDNIWMFGYDNEHFNLPKFGGVNFDFSTVPPSIYPVKKKIDMAFYCGVCSDSSGVLEFYTNGISIRDTTHNIMLNGNHINPGPVWGQWQNDSYPNGPYCFALPAPGQPDQYYFFHMGTTLTYKTSPFYYTIIDMNGNNGLGEVTLKNQIILPGNNEEDYTTPVAVKHGNGRDWWVITGKISTPKVFTFLLDMDGVHGPFETDMPFTFPGPEYQSVSTMSPDGRTYVRCDGNNGLYIYDFDRCSGTFDNLRSLPFADESFYGFATVFASDSRHLYLSSFTELTVLDLEASDISASFDTLVYFDGNASPAPPFMTGFFIPNLGADGKIYYATTNSTLSLHIIHDPNQDGPVADVEQHGIDLPKLNDGTMCLFPNYRLGEWADSPCDTLASGKPGFQPSQWYPPAQHKMEGYTLLSPIGRKNAQAEGDQPRPYRPRIAEMAVERLKERKREKEQAVENADKTGKKQ